MLYEISGGTLNANSLNVVAGTTSAHFRVVGSDITAINIDRFLNWHNAGTSVREFILDNGSNHITTIQASLSQPLTGELRVGLRGGVMLSGVNSFHLLEAASFSGSWGTTPGGLWTTDIANDINGTRDAVRVTLNNSDNKGTLSRGGGVTFASSAYGYVALSGVALNEPLKLHLDITGGTLANLTDALTAAGIIWQAGSGGYDLMLTLDPATSGATYFAWDFGPIDGAMSLQGLQIVPKGTVVSIR